MFIWNAVLLSVLNIICTLAGIILNSVVIVSLWNSQHRKKLCYFMIFILACFDLVVVVVCHPLVIIRIISRWISVDVIEHWDKYICCISFNFSLIALLTMTLERYLALVYPFFHERFATKSRLMTAIVLFQLPLNTLSSVNKELVSNVSVGAVLLVIFILNFKLFIVTRSLRKRAVVTLGQLDRPESEPRNDLDTKKLKITLSSSGKISTCVLVAACLFICYVPWIVNMVILQRSGIKALVSDQNAFIIKQWTDTFCGLNSSLNCLIFFYKNTVLRHHGGAFIKRYFCGRKTIG